MPHIIGISGKIGSGKDYLADKLIEAVERSGGTVRKTHFGSALKEELSEIIDYIRDNHDETHEVLSTGLSEKMDFSEKDASFLTKLIAVDVLADGTLTGWTKVPNIRTALQYLGTTIRRGQNPNYWSDKVAEELKADEHDFVIVADLRFQNEAATLQNLGATLLRLQVSENTLHQRRLARDGVTMKYTPEQINHTSETELDDYQLFHLKVGEQFEADSILTTITNNG